MNAGESHAGEASTRQRLEPTEPIARRETRDRAPLSFAQRPFWLLDQLAPGNAVHNIPVVTKLAGRLDAGALERGLHVVARRHETLRTGFELDGDDPIQRVAADAAPSLERVDFSGAPGAQREAAAWLEASIRRPFDLRRPPLLRASLVRLSDEEHILALVVHHIIADAWSLAILRRELTAAYEAERSGRAPTLPPLPVQYGDYAVWQHARAVRGEYRRQVAFWKRQLADLTTLALPADRPRPPVQTYRGSAVPFALSQELSASLGELARRTGATLSMILLAALQALLARYSGQDDVVLGSQVANRNRTELEGLIGLFAGSLVLRMDLRGDPTFRELLRRVRDVSLDAYSNQDVPFELLVDELQPTRDRSRSPLFQTQFVSQPDMAFGLGSLQVQPLRVRLGASRFDLTVQVAPAQGIVRGFFEYNTDLFDDWRIQQMTRHYVRMLEGVSADCDRPVARVRLLTEAERAVLTGWSRSARETPKATVPASIESQIERRGAATAMVCGERRWTYAELDAHAGRVAGDLAAAGTARADVVGVLLPRSLELVAAMLGVLRSGAVFLPLDPLAPRNRLAVVLDDARPPVVVTTRQLAQELPAGLRQVIVDAPRQRGARVAGVRRAAPAPRDAAYVMYTSGSTGQPKGVVVEHGALAAFFAGVNAVLAFDEDERHVAMTTPTFDISILELLLPLCQGGQVIVATPEEAYSPAGFSALVARHAATSAQTTPSHWGLLVQHDDERPDRLRVLVGGEALPVGLAKALLGWAGQVTNLYGPTETTIWASAHRLTDADVRESSAAIVSVGTPLSNYDIAILDKCLEHAPAGVPGEVYIAGPALARGYLNRPGATAARFVANPHGPAGSRMYRTGDAARRHPGGRLEFLGRDDRQVKVRGFRVELGEIESMLRKHDSVEDAVATVHGQDAEARIVAYVVLRKPGAHEGEGSTDLVDKGGDAAARLQHHLRLHLPDYMVPAAVMVLPAWPLTPSGKTDRRALPPPEFRSAGPSRAPASEHERIVVETLAGVLGIERVGVDDDFFELGGNSLMAMSLVARLRRRFGVGIAVSQFFDEPTAEALARAIEIAVIDEIEQMDEAAVLNAGNAGLGAA